jgi:hypothetical protein
MSGADPTLEEEEDGQGDCCYSIRGFRGSIHNHHRFHGLLSDCLYPYRLFGGKRGRRVVICRMETMQMQDIQT